MENGRSSNNKEANKKGDKIKMIKISYKKRLGENGTVYYQLIRINDKILIDKFNNYVKNELKRINDKKLQSSYDIQKLAYLETLKNGVNYIHLTTLIELISLLMQYYDYSVIKRIKYNNTIVKVEG